MAGLHPYTPSHGVGQSAKSGAAPVLTAAGPASPHPPLSSSSVTAPPRSRNRGRLGEGHAGHGRANEAYLYAPALLQQERHPQAHQALAEGSEDDFVNQTGEHHRQPDVEQRLAIMLSPRQPHYAPQQEQGRAHQHGGQFGVLTPHPRPAAATPSWHTGEAVDVVDVQAASHSQSNKRLVPDPPDLEAWRALLFSVDGRIVLTSEQFETYFPHVDNVYSHRSTQRYKRKPFVSHYWDCRMKGRPPGTPKSDDPNKKKRKRTVRERDLCDVKIKITEYFPGAQIVPEASDAPAGEGSGLGLLSLAQPITVEPGQRYWTLQRVNGNGNNGKGDGVAGPHKHTLEKSDDIKKNSVQRHLAQQTKGITKPQQQVRAPRIPQRRATGTALSTVRKHSKESDFKLFAACFCPFSQRVWIALEAKGISYQYCEVDPFQKPTAKQLLEANPRGVVPAIRHGEWRCAESAVILEYLEDVDNSTPLYPPDPHLKATCRLWIDHINTRIVPAFFALLRGQNLAIRVDYSNQLQTQIESLVLAADEQGPYFLGNSLSLVDIHLAPFALRLSRLLQPLHGWTDPNVGVRWQRWLEAFEGNGHIKATTSSRELYKETAELLAQQQLGATNGQS